MSWLARSIANSLKLDDDNENEVVASNDNNATAPKSPSKLNPDADSSTSASSTPTARGVKDDLSELTKTLSRQFWGVATFLAPPPDSSSPHSTQISDSSHPKPSDRSETEEEESDPKISEEDVIAGIRSDFAEIGGRFKSGISKLSNNMAVSEFTKIASNFLQFGSEEDDLRARGAVGVTDEVLAFARNIAMHPETWLDFPLPDDDESDDFELSDAQQEHALAVEHLTPRLAALRIELCPGHMSESYFWKIYFVLLHPRLNKQDAELLSTPQIVEARSMLTQELQHRAKGKPDSASSESGSIQSKGTADSPREQHLSVPSGAQADILPLETSKTASDPTPEAGDVVTEKHPVQSTEIKVIDKPVVEEEPLNQKKYKETLSGSSSKTYDEKFEDDADDWLKEDTSEMVGVSGTSIPIENDEDVSFSDLEEDDGEVPSSYKKATSGSDSSAKESRDWVQLSRSSADSDKEINTIEIRHVGSEQVSPPNTETKEANDWLDVDDIDVM
ncbi:hypothetical protein FEM48_Zijuj08G0132200 [Ziziphus jujuba var. spinosa]|uniref:BSD domain-containing protein n=1 Tax=Ziziphus jujuba var. spinosa TaxID=714518 RepID=A0A978UZB0_ZIZJJ|nr:hypothetical protein FEM48_Zijuj08G0132200 [Ziziphus jujuba var. spinosa]